MLKKIKKADSDTWLWEMELRVGSKKIHRRFVSTQKGANQIHAEWLDTKARQKMGLSYQLPLEAKSLKGALAEYTLHLQTLDRHWKHIADSEREITNFANMLGDRPVNTVLRSDLLNWQVKRHTVEWAQQHDQRKYKTPPKPASARTVNKARAELLAFFSWCQKHGWTENNPAACVPRIKEIAGPLKAISWEQFNKLADYMWKYRPCLALLVEVLGETGARIQEVLSATKSQVDLHRKTWSKIVKPGRRVELPAGPWLMRAAQQAKGSSDPLCPREDGQPFKYQVVKRAFEEAAKELDLPLNIGPHWLRHGRGTWDAEAGVPVRAIQEKLSHTTVSTTEKYLRAAEALKLHQEKAPSRAISAEVCGLDRDKSSASIETSRDSAGLHGNKEKSVKLEKKKTYDVSRYCKKNMAG